MDFSTVKAITIPQGDVKYISANNQCLWTNLVFNQLVTDPECQNVSSWISERGMLTKVDSGIRCTFTGTYSAGSFVRFMNRTTNRPIVGHKYFRQFKCKDLAQAPAQDQSFLWGGMSYGSWGSTTAERHYFYGELEATLNTIETARATGSSCGFIENMSNCSNIVGGEYFTVQRCIAIDLTAMYGEGNEPTTIAQVFADCAAIGHDLNLEQRYIPI